MSDREDRAAQESARRHVETAWACQVRPIVELEPLHALTVADVMRAVVLLEPRRIPAATHSWIDVPLSSWHAARRLAADFACPALVVARFDDAVLFGDAGKLGPAFALCGADGAARVRLEVRRLSPVQYESRW